jgi:hypothetical protein
MERMERLARISLIWDAGHCVVTGLAITIAFHPVAVALQAPRPAIGLIGLLTVAWGVAVGFMSGADRWRSVTTLAVAVNLSVTAAIGAMVLTMSLPDGGEALLLVIAAQVFAFAAIEAHALWSPFGR